MVTCLLSVVSGMAGEIFSIVGIVDEGFVLVESVGGVLIVVVDGVRVVEGEVEIDTGGVPIVVVGGVVVKSGAEIDTHSQESQTKRTEK